MVSEAQGDDPVKEIDRLKKHRQDLETKGLKLLVKRYQPLKSSIDKFVQKKIHA